MADDIDDYLASKYFDTKHPGSFSGINKFFHHLDKSRVNKQQVSEWLARNETYSGYREIRRRFKRPVVIVSGKFSQIDSDVAHLAQYKTENRGYSYFVVCVDILTRVVMVEALKTTTGEEMLTVLKRMFKKHKPKTLRTDRGSEYIGKKVQNWLKRSSIKYMKTDHEVKANYAEIIIKNFKNKIIKSMFKRQSNQWIDLLQDIANSYNDTKHRSIGITPNEALAMDEAKLWRLNYLRKIKSPEKITFKFQIGDVVKISHLARKLQRHYDRKWSFENFIISERLRNQYIPMYVIKSWNNDPVLGKFYSNELQKVIVDHNTVYNIEKTLKRRRRNRVTELLVRWQGWGPDYDSWLPESEVLKIQKAS
jgi:hypothetical protein